MSTHEATVKSESLIISLVKLKKKEKDNYYKKHTKTSASTKSRWFGASPGARLVVDHMRRITPLGAAPPWRAGPSVEPVQILLDDGVVLQDLLDHATDCAGLIVRRVTSERWWYPGHVFGPRTMPRWAADAAKMRATMVAAAQRQEELAALADSPTPEHVFEGDVVPVALASFASDLGKMLQEPDYDSRSASKTDAGSVSA